jgi:hypothetical protein
MRTCTYHNLVHGLAVASVNGGRGSGIGVLVRSRLEVVRHLRVELGGGLLGGASAAAAALLGRLATLGSGGLLVSSRRLGLGLGLSLWLTVMLVRPCAA